MWWVAVAVAVAVAIVVAVALEVAVAVAVLAGFFLAERCGPSLTRSVRPGPATHDTDRPPALYILAFVVGGDS